MNDKNISEQFCLLKNIIKFSETANLKVDLNEIENIIFKILPDTLGKNAPSNFPELYFDFKHEYERFKEFILYEKLIGKNIIALGGGFSSGKSSFLNSIIGSDILPYDITPSTSVPAYLVNGEEISAYGINTFESKVEMDIGDVALLGHGFGKDIGDGTEITLGHLLSSLFISTPDQPFKNVAFLDTPGYSKADSESYSSKTDEKIARVQLNTSNFILWFVQIDAGTIPESDIQFIRSLKPEIPKLIIVNKADKVMPDEVGEIIEKIKDVLNIKGISVLDVLAYSSEEPDDYDKDKILEYLNNWNNGVTQSRFAYNFKVLFTKCTDYYDEILDEEKKQHSRLSHILADSSLESNEARDYLNSMDNQAKKNIVHIKELKDDLKMLQNEFFTEIKRISDIVDIEMPEPSEIDLLQDKISDPKNILDIYCEKHGLNAQKNINTRGTVALKLTEQFENIVPIFNKITGGTDYNIAISDELEKSLIIDKTNIRINQCLNIESDAIYCNLGGN